MNPLTPLLQQTHQMHLNTWTAKYDLQIPQKEKDALHCNNK